VGSFVSYPGFASFLFTFLLVGVSFFKHDSMYGVVGYCLFVFYADNVFEVECVESVVLPFFVYLVDPFLECLFFLVGLFLVGGFV
jgi:hypothetical protein